MREMCIKIYAYSHLQAIATPNVAPDEEASEDSVNPAVWPVTDAVGSNENANITQLVQEDREVGLAHVSEAVTAPAVQGDIVESAEAAEGGRGGAREVAFDSNENANITESVQDDREVGPAHVSEAATAPAAQSDIVESAEAAEGGRGVASEVAFDSNENANITESVQDDREVGLAHVSEAATAPAVQGGLLESAEAAEGGRRGASEVAFDSNENASITESVQVDRKVGPAHVSEAATSPAAQGGLLESAEAAEGGRGWAREVAFVEEVSSRSKRKKAHELMLPPPGFTRENLRALQLATAESAKEVQAASEKMTAGIGASITESERLSKVPIAAPLINPPSILEALSTLRA